MGIALSATAHLICTRERPIGAERFNPDWRTETVKTLAKGILVDYAFDRFPILADALEEAGCQDPLVLKHCRECGQHRHSCWVLTSVTGRTLPPPDPAELSTILQTQVLGMHRRTPGTTGGVARLVDVVRGFEKAIYLTMLLIVLSILLLGFFSVPKPSSKTKVIKYSVYP